MQPHRAGGVVDAHVAGDRLHFRLGHRGELHVARHGADAHVAEPFRVDVAGHGADVEAAAPGKLDAQLSAAKRPAPAEGGLDAIAEGVERDLLGRRVAHPDRYLWFVGGNDFDVAVLRAHLEVDRAFDRQGCRALSLGLPGGPILVEVVVASPHLRARGAHQRARGHAIDVHALLVADVLVVAVVVVVVLVVVVVVVVLVMRHRAAGEQARQAEAGQILEVFHLGELGNRWNFRDFRDGGHLEVEHREALHARPAGRLLGTRRLTGARIVGLRRRRLPSRRRLGPFRLGLRRWESCCCCKTDHGFASSECCTTLRKERR